MPDLSEIFSIKVFSLSLITAFSVLFFLVKKQVFRSWIDPALLPWFQIVFTFTSLVVVGILPFSQVCYFIIFVLLVLFTNKIRVKRVRVISQALFESFSYPLFFFCIVANALIIMQKGFIFLANDISDAKLFYYQDFGIFKRINEIATPILAITGIKFWRQGKRKTPVAYFILSAFCLVTLGSKSGLLTLIFLYGSYVHFNTDKEKEIFKKNRFAFLSVGIILIMSSFLMFFFIFQDTFLQAFFFRFIAYADGPIFFYYQELGKHISYDPMYMFDQLFNAMRIRPELKYESLGPLINYYTLGVDNELMGPNPQIFVESSVLFHSFAFLFYLLAYLIFFFCRKIASTPYTFYFLTGFATTFFIDTQYAFYQVFNLMILGVMLAMFMLVRTLLYNAALRFKAA